VTGFAPLSEQMMVCDVAATSIMSAGTAMKQFIAGRYEMRDGSFMIVFHLLQREPALKRRRTHADTCSSLGEHPK
jgi:hypothetical protein